MSLLRSTSIKLTSELTADLDTIGDELIGEQWHYGAAVCHAARDEIMRLRAEIEYLKSELGPEYQPGTRP
jgi:hypothetical protein